MHIRMESLKRPDDGYFIRIPALARPAHESIPTIGSIVVGDTLELTRGTGPAGARTMGVLTIVGGLVGGFAATFLFMILSAVFSMWGSSSSGDFAFAIGVGVFVAICGLTGGILRIVPWSKPSRITVAGDVMVLYYVGFRRPWSVSRAAIRVVAVDETPVQFFHNNKRFPVRGDLPPEAFADALDRYPVPPWDPDDRPPMFPPGFSGDGKDEAYLFSGDGVSLPVMKMNPEDVPNVAVILHEPMRTPQHPWGFLPPFVFAGRRTVKGFMVRVREPGRARALFGSWNVVRDVTADDVLDEDLRVAKPLRGWRIPVYATIVLMPLLLRILFRIAHHR
jgi:hypothetical protein